MDLQTFLLFVYLLTIIISVTGQYNEEDEESQVKIELQMIDYELEDKCENLSMHIYNALLRHPGSLKKKILAEESYGNYLREMANQLKTFDVEEVPYDLQRNWTILTKSGDALLPEDDWNERISFYNTNTEISYFIKVPCPNSTDGCTYKKQETLDLLATSRNLTVLKSIWSASQNTTLSSSKEKFHTILKQINTAAKENDAYSTKIYWEMLNQCDDAYSKAFTLWEEIQPFYEKLHAFVKKRLYKHYNITENYDEIPVYLLGSNFGTDWLNIADIVLPHPQLHYEANTKLKEMNIQEIYKLAENLTESLNLGSFGSKFWQNSIFNMSTCNPHILGYCTESYTQLLTCNKTNLNGYLQAHINAMKIVLNNQDYSSVMRQTMRFSAVDEAIYGLGEIFAIDNLPNFSILPNDVFKNDEKNYNNKMTALLLKALTILPRLPYYLLADQWRLEELESSSVNVSKTWWEARKKFQKIQGITNLEYDFLEDENILLNKPYISKFFGTFLQFQIIEYYKNMLSEDANIIDAMGKDTSFSSLIQERTSKEWPYSVNYQFGIYDVSSSSLLEYFQPLQEYMDKAPLEQVHVKILKPKTNKINVSRNKQESGKYIKKKLIIDDVQNDGVTEEASIKKTVETPEKAQQQTAMYVGIGVLVLVMVSTCFYLHQKSRRKEPKPNNRRFEA